MASSFRPDTSTRAREVIRLTARAWGIRVDSPRAVARRAPHGYVPRRRQALLQRIASLQGPACPALGAYRGC